MGLTKLNNQSLNAVTSAGLPSGTVLQVVTAVSSGSSNTTNTWTDTGLSASITPTSANNKILVHVTHPTRVLRTVSDNWLGGLKLLRGSTVIGNGDNYTIGQTHPGESLDDGGTYWWWTSHELDSPSSTSSVTYKTQSRADGSGSVATFAGSRMTLMEIAG